MATKHPSPFLREFARRLKAAREEQHMTQQDVYNATGIHVARIEANDANTTLITLATLCKHYKVRLATLVADLEDLIEEPNS